jgi:hypothetical protein
MRIWFFVCILFFLLANNSTAGDNEQLSSIEISIPEYKVETKANFDYVSIPGGEILLAEEGRPRVPYFVKTINYPKEYRIQDVILKERTGLTTSTGLKLPVVIIGPPTDLLKMKEGWYPEEDYKWKVWVNRDGSSTLIIRVYPFFYNPDTTNVKFYRYYKFDINYILSTIAIAGLSVDKNIYQPKDTLAIDMWLNNSGETEDVIVNTIIKQSGTDEIIDGLALRSLKSFSGEAFYSTEWTIDDHKPGYYYVEVCLTDSSGNIYDKKTIDFNIQEQIKEIEKQLERPQHIEAGLTAEPINYSGFCPTTITFKGEISVTQPGEVQYKFIRSDGALAPVQTLHFDKPTSKEVRTTWRLGKDYSGWMAIKILYPQEVESNKAHFSIKCEQ